jgi:hypothetical protein
MLMQALTDDSCSLRYNDYIMVTTVGTLTETADRASTIRGKGDKGVRNYF